VPSLKTAVSHQLTQDEALSRIKRFTQRAKTEYSDKITDWQESWDGNVGTFRVSGMGQTVTASVSVEASQVIVQSSLPLLAIAFKGKIESAIRDQLGALLR
jgi:hypothetical protein